MPNPFSLPDLRDIAAARHRIAGRIRRTPLLPSPWLSRLADRPVWLKLENLQVTRSFKTRGACNALLRTVAADRGAPHEVVTSSAGNHGLALAHAGRALGIAVTVFTPKDAAAAKRHAIAHAGATLHPVAKDYDEAERMALDYARERGARFVSPYNDPDVIAGAGTIGLEIAEDLPDVSAVLVPLGGGGLSSGIALALSGLSRDVRVLGVEPAVNPAFTRALESGRITPIEVHSTLADGLGGNIEPGSITFELVQTLLDDVVTVTEASIAGAMRATLAEERFAIEGAAAVGVAALLDGVRPAGDGPIVVVISGANLDVRTLAVLTLDKG